MSIHDDQDQHKLHGPAQKKDIQPLPDGQTENAPSVHKNELAADLIRKKIDALYGHEPDAQKEAQEAKEAGTHRSKHQEFMYQLSISGKPVAQIQQEWHTYYIGLTDSEKHEVWQEFYANQNTTREQPIPPKTTSDNPLIQTPAVPHDQPESVPAPPPSGPITFKEVKDQLLTTVSRRSRPQKINHHLHSLIFGIGMGSLAVLILMFGFFNERFIAPFITPSRAVSNTPIIIDPNSTAAGPEPKVIIPKINVEIPVVYDEPSVEEEAVQQALERGVVHYASTPNPGEVGNTVIFGHSSNNILNRGKYKFAFVLLSRLETGDTFVLTKDGIRYVYKVYEKKIVTPTEVSVLFSAGKPATATLITCDPPGTTTNRLVVIGEQISPNPAENKASTAKQTNGKPNVVPGNAPSLWSNFTGWLF